MQLDDLSSIATPIVHFIAYLNSLEQFYSCRPLFIPESAWQSIPVLQFCYFVLGIRDT